MKQGTFRLSAAGLALIIALTIGLPATAEPQHLQKLKDPFIVEIQTPLDGSLSKPGDLFEAVLQDELVYGEGEGGIQDSQDAQSAQTLPAGTRFMGHVEDSRKSKRFGRRGYLVLNVDKVVFPDGTEAEILLGDYAPREKKSWDEKTFREKQKNKKRWFLKAPLSAVSFVAPFPIGLAVRGGAGLIMGLTDKDTRHEPVIKRVGKGLYNVTPIPTMVNFVKKQPTPSYKPGDRIYLYMPEEALAQLLEGGPATQKDTAAENGVAPF